MFDLALIINFARVIVFNLPNITRGFVFSSLQYTSYAIQRELIQGDNGNIGTSVGLVQAIMANVLMSTLAFAFPTFSALQVFSYIAWGAYLAPIFAGYAVGGYKNLKERMTEVEPDRAEHSIQKRSRQMFEIADKLLSKIPPRLSVFLSVLIAKSHKWFGSIFFTAQVAILGILAVTQPWIGITGLIYLGMTIIRAIGYMPLFIAKPMEKINRWLVLFAGLTMGGFTLLVISSLSIVIEFTINFILPRFMNWKFSEINSDVMRIENLTTDIGQKQYEPRLPRDIKAANIYTLSAAMPCLDLEIDQDENRTFDTALADEINRLEEDLMNFADSRNEHWLSSFKSFIDQLPITKGGGLGVTLRHMSDVSLNNVVAAEVDFNNFKKVVKESDLRKSVESFKVKCLSSAKFWKHSETIEQEMLQATYCIDADIQSMYKKVKLNPTNEQENANNLEARKAIISKKDEKKAVSAQFNSKIIRAHGDTLCLPPTATDDDIIIAFIENQLETMYTTIETGGMLWEKKVESVGQFKNEGRHVINHCKNLIQTEQSLDIIVAHDILGQMAIEAADFCSTGSFDIVHNQFLIHVIPVLLEAKGSLSIRDKVLMQLQNKRQQLFDTLYTKFMKLPLVKLMIINSDPSDRHFYNKFVNLFESFNIIATFNAKSDLSTQQSGKTHFIFNVISYVGARLMMSLDVAYSPTGIVSGLIQDTKEAISLDTEVGEESAFKGFNIFNCCKEWAKEFSPEVSQKMTHIIDNGSDKAKRKLIALMLYDFDVFSTNGKLDQKFKEVLPSLVPPATPVVVPQQTNSRWSFPTFNTLKFRSSTSSFSSQETPAGLTTARTERNQTVRNSFG